LYIYIANHLAHNIYNAAHIVYSNIK